MHYRSIFISDVHLGTPGCQAEELLEFLKEHESDYLYLVGDIIDGWQLRRRWYWPQAHNDVVQKLLRRARKGCKVIYVPGNHDEFAREFLNHQFGGVEVVEEAIHQTADGKYLWIIHGDYFDAVVQQAKWLAYVGDYLYEFTLKMNRYLNNLRGRLGFPYWSLSAYLKHKVKKALNYITDFEEAVAREAAKHGYQGVVSGEVAASIWHQLKQTHLADIAHQVTPRLPLPVEQWDVNVAFEPPALIKGYLRLGAKVLGAPAWDPDFNTADLPMLMKIQDMPARYRKHFLGA